MRNPAPGVQLPAAQVLGSPVVSGGNLYLYSHACTGWSSGVCTAGKVYSATVAANPQAWRSAKAYQWYTNAQGGLSG